MATVTLTIAGSDPSGGAGIQADLKVFERLGVYGAAVITALTVQDTTAVRRVVPLDAQLVAEQLDAVLDDLPVVAVKTGMLANAAIARRVAACCAARPGFPLVVDPVLRATAGQSLADDDLLASLRADLLPLAALVTPNLSEAAALVGRPVHDPASMRDAARALVDLGAGAALVTGGHLPGRPRDILFADGAFLEFDGDRVPLPRTHGTGCALTAAIVAEFAHGRALADAVAAAKRFVAAALGAATTIGRGAHVLQFQTPPARSPERQSG